MVSKKCSKAIHWRVSEGHEIRSNSTWMDGWMKHALGSGRTSYLVNAADPKKNMTFGKQDAHFVKPRLPAFQLFGVSLLLAVVTSNFGTEGKVRIILRPC